MKRIYLIDCPGVVPPNQNDTEEDILLRGVCRVENVENPEQYIPGVLKRTKTRHLERTYDVKGFTDSLDFLSILARKGGRLLKGGEPDVDGVAKMVINDFLRGKIPWFTPPPHDEDAKEGEAIDGRDGRLGEMTKKRKRNGEEEDKDKDKEQASASASSKTDDADEGSESDSDSDAVPQVNADEEDSFAGFSSDEGESS